MKHGTASTAPELFRSQAAVVREKMDSPRARGTGEIEPVVALDTDDVAQIVHDMRAPLATMTLDAFLMETKLQREDYSGLLAAIRRNGHNVSFLERLIDDLLDLCALDTRHFTLERTRNDLLTLLEEVIDRIVPSCDRARVHLDGRSVPITVDELRIQRVMSNLITNALKYASRGDVIIRLERMLRSARVTVVDCGPGLSAEEAAGAFDKYRRCASSKGCGGAGLGLYICKQIVVAHGGTVGIESELGVGSRFFIELPLDP